MNQARNDSLTKAQQPSEENQDLLKLGPNLTCRKGSHEFMYKTALEVECMKCPVGYPLGAGAQLKNGHIYIHGEFVI
jgi:hypothetical protein